MRKFLVGVLLLCLLGTALVSAGGKKEAEVRPVRDVIRVRSINGADIHTLDPAFYRGDEELNIDLAIHSKLMMFKPGSSELMLDAAESVDVSGDGLKISFKLREGIQFHRGYGEMTAEDVKFSFERMIDPEMKAVYAAEWSALDRVEITGKYSGILHLKEAYAPMFTQTIPYSPGSIISKKAYEELGDRFAINPVGAGPYKFVEWLPEQRVVIERFDDYYGEKPDIRRIEMLPITDVLISELAFESADLDYTQIGFDSIDRYRNDPAAELHQVGVTRQVYIGFNMEQPPFDNAKVREAVRYAVDVEAILTGAYNNVAKRANSSIVQGVLGHWADAPQYNVDLDRARRLMREAGQASGFTTKLTISPREPMPEAAQIVQQDLRQIGINVEINIADSQVEELGHKSISGMHLQDWGPSIEPERWLIWWHSRNIGGWNFKKYNNPQYDTLVLAAARQMDTARRQQMYVDLQKMLDKDITAVWISNSAHLAVSKPYVTPVFMTQRSQYRFWKLNQ